MSIKKHLMSALDHVQERVTHRRHISFVVYGPEVVEELKGPHESLWGWRVHEVKVDLKG
jgi:hypothetical protein